MDVDTVEDVTAYMTAVTAVEDGAPNVVTKNEVSTIFSAVTHPRTIGDGEPNVQTCLALKFALFYLKLFAPVFIIYSHSEYCDMDIFCTISTAINFYIALVIAFINISLACAPLPGK